MPKLVELTLKVKYPCADRRDAHQLAGILTLAQRANRAIKGVRQVGTVVYADIRQELNDSLRNLKGTLDYLNRVGPKKD